MTNNSKPSAKTSSLRENTEELHQSSLEPHGEATAGGDEDVIVVQEEEEEEEKAEEITKVGNMELTA